MKKLMMFLMFFLGFFSFQLIEIYKEINTPTVVTDERINKLLANDCKRIIKKDIVEFEVISKILNLLFGFPLSHISIAHDKGCIFNMYVSSDSFYQGKANIEFNKDNVIHKISFYSFFDTSLLEAVRPTLSFNFFRYDNKFLIIEGASNRLFVVNMDKEKLSVVKELK